MSGRTTIEWTAQPGYVGAVWNPTTGCTRVSDGCSNCYAFALHDKRYKANLDAAKKNAGHTSSEDEAFYRRFTVNGWGLIERERERGAALPFPKQYDLPFSRVQLLEDRLDVPLRTRKPTCYFVASMADLFHEDVPDEFIAKVWATMREATRHRFLILTKRPRRIFHWMLGWDVDAWRNPLPNVWLGTSVEDQRAADERIPHLLATPAAVRFLSCEPLIGPLNLTRYMPRPGEAILVCPSCGKERWFGPGPCGRCDAPPPPLNLHWLIAGGESSPRARPMDLAWARSLRDQCAAAGVGFFMKQLGSKPVSDWPIEGMPIDTPHVAYGTEEDPHCALKLREAHGRNPDEWPEDLRVRQWPR